MFIKFTIVLVAVYFLFRGGMVLHMNTWDDYKKAQMAAHDYSAFTPNDLALFEAFGLLHITTYICVVISVALFVFKWIGGIL